MYACTNANNVDTRLYQSIYTHTRRSKIVFRYIFLDDISIEMSSQSYLVDVKCKKKRGRSFVSIQMLGNYVERGVGGGEKE